MIKKLTYTLSILSGMAYAQPLQGTAPHVKEHQTKISYATVLEKKEAMGYLYLKVDENGTKRWVAIAKAPVNVGDKIGYDTRTVMKQFKSKSLDRVFDEIVFANEVYLPSKPTAPASMKALLAKDIKSAEEKADLKDFKVKPFYTVEEVHRYRSALAGKEISVKATVYKVSRGILKRDWVHLGDGTGNEKKLTDDLVFTTPHTDIKAGDKVVAKAKIVIDKDFGYGYFYKVMGENAIFKVR